MQVSLSISLFLAWSCIIQRENTYYFNFSLHICSLLTIIPIYLQLKVTVKMI